MKLNVGCGKKYEPEYINVDFYEDLIADKLMSAVNLDFEDFCFKEVKAVQIIEHLTFFEAIYALNEFFRVLKLNGKLILEIPDLKKICQLYLKSNEDQIKVILGWFYGVPDKGLQHKFCFPIYLLREILENIGFINIETTYFFNTELIPIVRIECHKSRISNDVEIFQVLANVHKILQSEGHVDFNNSLLIKEQEDLLSLYSISLLDYQKTHKISSIFEVLVDSLMKWPQSVKILLRVLKDKRKFSQLVSKRVLDVTDLLIRLNFPNILCHSFKNIYTYPGTQKIAFSSIESFAKKTIKKLMQKDQENENIINKLKIIRDKIEYPEIEFFSLKILEKKSLDYFYLGIKAFYKDNYKIAYNYFLKAIKLYRDDFLFFWNLAKILVKLNQETKAIKYYKRTLRLVKITKLNNKNMIRNEIIKEYNSLKKNKEVTQEFKPIMSIENL
jgi:predicted SAM-dependent methyltransferase